MKPTMVGFSVSGARCTARRARECVAPAIRATSKIEVLCRVATKKIVAKLRPHLEACLKYGQFCPLAKASEVLGERWMLLVLRELVSGSTRYKQLQRGLG